MAGKNTGGGRAGGSAVRGGGIGGGGGRGGLVGSGYVAGWARGAACLSARRPRSCRLGRGRPLRPVVLGMLGQRWSPAQIAARLVVEFPDRPEMRVCHETIYQALYLQ